MVVRSTVPQNITIDPTNGDLLVVNGAGNNDLIELTPTGQVVAVRNLAPNQAAEALDVHLATCHECQAEEVPSSEAGNGEHTLSSVSAIFLRRPVTRR